MFYRVGKFKHELGKTDEIMDFFKSNEDTFKAVSYTHLTLPTKRIV